MQRAGASNTASGSRLVRDQRPTSGSLLPSGGVLEQLKSGKQNSNWCLDAPPQKGWYHSRHVRCPHTSHASMQFLSIWFISPFSGGRMTVICEQPSVLHK